MSKININSIKRKAFKAKKIEKSADRTVEQLLEKNKIKFLNEFDSHPVTQEISSGQNSSNLSGSLGGRGNLFSFIGFFKSDSPIQELRSFLEKSFSFKRRRTVNKLNYVIEYPSLEKIKAETPMPWEGGKSWALSIEKGISGLSYYLANKFSEKSRSGKGLQAKNKISNLNYKPITYMSQIIKNFKRNFK